MFMYAQYAGAIGLDFILMDDNARPHRDRRTNEYLTQETIYRMDWHVRSPDLNPIEHVWGMLQQAISCRQVQSNRVADLQVVIRGVGQNSTIQDSQTYQQHA